MEFLCLLKRLNSKKKIQLASKINSLLFHL